MLNHSDLTYYYQSQYTLTRCITAMQCWADKTFHASCILLTACWGAQLSGLGLQVITASQIYVVQISPRRRWQRNIIWRNKFANWLNGLLESEQNISYKKLSAQHVISSLSVTGNPCYYYTRRFTNFKISFQYDQ